MNGHSNTDDPRGMRKLDHSTCGGASLDHHLAWLPKIGASAAAAELISQLRTIP